MPPKMLNEREGKSPLYYFLSALLTLVLVCLVLVLLFDVWVSRHCYVVDVIGQSMEETLHSGDKLYARKDVSPERGDIVIVDVTDHAGFPNQGKKDYFIIKRLIATEGDSVRWEEGTVYVRYAGTSDYVALDEPYVKGVTPRAPFLREEGITVGEGEVFVLGDNREDSTASDDVGCLPAEDVEGVVEQWAVSCKWYITAWENFRAGFRELLGG